MADWKENTIMSWAGNKITDHGRDALSMSTELIGNTKRMSNGTLRRHFVKNKRTWTCSWENLPSTNSVVGGYSTADGGWAGEDMEAFFNSEEGQTAFRLVLRRGSAAGIAEPNPSDSSLPYEDDEFYICNVMITEFSKDTVKRGMVDLWSISVTLEEV